MCFTNSCIHLHRTLPSHSTVVDSKELFLGLLDKGIETQTVAYPFLTYFVADINSDYSVTGPISSALFALMNTAKMVLKIKLNWNSLIITVQYSTFSLRFPILI